MTTDVKLYPTCLILFRYAIESKRIVDNTICTFDFIKLYFTQRILCYIIDI